MATGPTLFDESRDQRGRLTFVDFRIDPPPGDLEQALDALTRLYVISCGDWRKLGIAREPARRMAALQPGNPQALRLERTAEVPEIGARYAEAWAHAKLAHAHERGEWFRVDADLATAVLKAAARRAFAFRRHAAAFLLS